MDTFSAQQIHNESIIIDGLNASWFFDPLVLQKLRQGGVTAVNATVAAWHSPADTLMMLGNVFQLFRQHSDIITQIFSVSDIAEAKHQQKTGIILGFQDTAPLGGSSQLLAVYQQIGVRIIQLTYNFKNDVGCGCMESTDTGLTDFGKSVVAEMNRLGMLVDLSHCGYKTTLDAIYASAKPIAITHANPKSLCNVPRNKTDEELKAAAERGGVIGLVVFPLMLTGQVTADIEDYFRAIDTMVNLVGIDHTALGPDFMEQMPQEIAMQALDGLPPEIRSSFIAMPFTKGFSTVAEFAKVTEVLLQHGYTLEDVQKIMGRNWLKLYETVWK